MQNGRIFPGVHIIGAAISGPRIADTNFTDTGIFLIFSLSTPPLFRQYSTPKPSLPGTLELLFLVEEAEPAGAGFWGGWGGERRGGGRGGEGGEEGERRGGGRGGGEEGRGERRGGGRGGRGERRGGGEEGRGESAKGLASEHLSTRLSSLLSTPDTSAPSSTILGRQHKNYS